MKYINMFVFWLNAEDISNQMGGGCLIQAFRYMFVFGVLLSVIIFIIKCII